MNKSETIRTITQACTLMTQLASGVVDLIEENQALSNNSQTLSQENQEADQLLQLVKQMIQEHCPVSPERPADWRASIADLQQLDQMIRSTKKQLQEQVIHELSKNLMIQMLDRVANAEFIRGQIEAQLKHLNDRCTDLENTAKSTREKLSVAKDKIAVFESQISRQAEERQAVQRKFRILGAMIDHVVEDARRVEAKQANDQAHQPSADELSKGIGLEFNQEAARNLAKFAAKFHSQKPGAPKYLSDAAHPDWQPHDWVIEAIHGSFVYFAGIVERILNGDTDPEPRVGMPSWFPQEEL